MELIQLWAKLIFFFFPKGFVFFACAAVWLFSPDPSGAQSRGSPCCAGVTAAVLEQDGQGQRMGGWSGQLVGFGSCLRFGGFVITLKRVRRWAEGARSLRETVAVQFHLWASVSRLRAGNDSSLRSAKHLERSSVDGIRARQPYTCWSSMLKINNK